MGRNDRSGTPPLAERHPMLMVPTVITFGVVVYTNGDPFHFPNDAVRQAIIDNLSPGTGVGQVTCTDHGQPSTN